MSKKTKSLLTFFSLLLVGYWLAMFVGSHYPHYARFRPPVSGFDKMAHFAGYAGLAFLLSAVLHFRYLIRSEGKPSPKIMFYLPIVVFSITAVYGVIDELSQFPIPGRRPDILDWYADLAGSLLGLTCFQVAVLLFRKRSFFSFYFQPTPEET
ncbi:MAG: VanZ family protein [Pirellulaceae bacterium]|nr:VanZ family protein [Pirellulaceae bacterium]